MWHADVCQVAGRSCEHNCPQGGRRGHDYLIEAYGHVYSSNYCHNIVYKILIRVTI